MRKTITFLLFFLPQLIYSQSTSLTPSLLWQITSNGLIKPSYLYGTIHYIPVRSYFLTNRTAVAFNESKILATEQAFFMRYVSPESWRKIGRQKYLPDGKKLSDYLSAEEFDSLTYLMRKVHRIRKKKYSKYITLKPYYLYGILASKYYPTGTGYEEELWRLANFRNKTKQYMLFEGLEEFKVTLSYIDSLDLETEAKDLLHQCKTKFADYRNSINAYHEQDIQWIYDYVACNERLHQLLVVQRNLSWIKKIQKLIHSQPTFIAVGAAHLAGPQGLIALLQEQGYTVEPLRDNSVINQWSNYNKPGSSKNE